MATIKKKNYQNMSNGYKLKVNQSSFFKQQLKVDSPMPFRIKRIDLF